MLGIFLDTETTGLDPTKHRAIDIAFKIIDMTTGELKGEYQSVVKQSEEAWKEHDPESIAVNGYTWERVQKGKDLRTVASEIKEIFKRAGVKRGEAFFICQNPAFDRGFFNQFIPVYIQEKLNWPYHWLDLASMYWGQVVMKSATPPKHVTLSKDSIGEKYGLEPEVHPHLAINGVNHLIQCYKMVMGLDWSN